MIGELGMFLPLLLSRDILVFCLNSCAKKKSVWQAINITYAAGFHNSQISIFPPRFPFCPSEKDPFPRQQLGLKNLTGTFSLKATLCSTDL